MTLERLDNPLDLRADANEERDMTLPPHSLQAEEAVLGSVMKSGKALTAIADRLRPEDFYVARHRHIYKAMLGLYYSGDPIDYHTLADRLTQDGTYEVAGGLLYLSELNLATPTAANVVHYAEIVARTATMRGLISSASSIAEIGYQGKDDAATATAKAERIISDLRRRALGASMKGLDYAAAVGPYIAAMQAKVEGEDRMAGVSTGLSDVDRMTLGYAPGNLVIVCARTSMGKSVFVQQNALHIANVHGPVTYVSIEMGVQKLMHRATAMVTGIPRARLMTGHVSEKELDLVVKANARMSELPLRMHTGRHTAADIRLAVQRHADDVGQLAGVVVDYIQLVAGGGNRNYNRVQELGEISAELKAIAEDFKVPVIAPAQISRAVEGRRDTKPTLSDLRESGNLEQDADLVLGLWRHDYYHRDSDQKGIAEVILMKDRDGGSPMGTYARVVWLTEYERYEDLQDDRRPTVRMMDGPAAPAMEKTEEIPW